MANEDLTARLQQQIDDLRAEVRKMGEALSEHAGAAFEDAQEYVDDLAEEAGPAVNNVVEHVWQDAAAIAETAREHPLMTLSVLFSVAGMGVALGMAIGTALMEERRPHRWFR